MIGNIRNSINKNADALKEGGAAALGTLVLGGSKAEAAMAGVGQAIATKVLGPLGKFAGIVAITTKGIYSMTKAWATMGTGAAAKLETAQNQMRVMLKGLDAAKQRLAELRKFSIVTPFKLPDLLAGNRALESLTKGALTTTKAMTMVGDAASQAGVQFQDMAVYVGRLYDGLAGGRPVGEVLFRLAELGVISGQARTSLEKLQETGAGFSEVWRTIEGELNRFQGTMAYTSQTLEGLQSTLEDTEEDLKATFSQNFLEGQKEAIYAYTKTLENIKPAVEGVGNAFGGFVSVASTLSAKMLRFLTELPGVATALEFLARAAAAAAASLAALAVVTGLTRLTGGLAALAVGANVGGRAMVFFAGALKIVRVALLTFMGPIMAVVGVLAVLYGAVSMYRDNLKRLEKAQREYNGATDATLNKLKAQAAAIKTLDDLAASYAATLDALAQAYNDSAQAAVDLREAKSDDGFLESQGMVELSDASDARGRKAGADRRIEKLQERLRDLDQTNRGGLESNQYYVEAQSSVKANRRNVEQAELEARRAMMTPTERAASLKQEANQLAARRGVAVTEVEGTEDYRKASAGMSEKLEKNRVEQIGADAKLKEERAKYSNNEGVPYDEYKKAADAVAALKAEEVALLKAQQQMAEAQDSEIVKLQAKISLAAQYALQQQSVLAVEARLQELQKEPDEENEDQRVKRLEAVKAALEALAREQDKLNQLQKAGADKISPRQQREMEEELKRKKAEVGGDLLNKPEEIRKRAEAAAAEREVKRTQMEEKNRLAEQLAGESGQRMTNVNGLFQMQNVGGEYAAAKAGLDAEKERLAMQLQNKEIEKDIYDLRMKAVASQERLLERERAKRNEEAAADLAVAQAGEDLGALAGAEEQVKQEQKKLDLAHQRGEIETSVYELQKKKLGLAQQELARRKAMAAGENAAGVQADQLNLQAKGLRLSGRGKEARALEEQARRAEEEAGKERRIREIMDSTGMDRAGAEQQVTGELGRARLGRQIDESGGLLQALLGQGQKVDSLQSVGGGGYSSSGPDLRQVVDRLDKLIRETKALGQTGVIP
jgi:hypothetical protein